MKTRKDIIVLLLVIIGLSIIYFSYKKDKNAILNNKGETIGLIYDFKSIKSGTSFLYEYYLDGKRYTNTSSFGFVCSQFIDTVLGRSFPVIYEGGNPQNSSLLITEKSFKSFDMKQPDSLSWVNEICK